MTPEENPGAAQLTLRLLDALAELRREHDDLRRRYADLLAAARATLRAAHDGELQALAFLTDELSASHGQHDLPPVGWAGWADRGPWVGR